jgi:hypothetical protein
MARRLSILEDSKLSDASDDIGNRRPDGEAQSQGAYAEIDALAQAEAVAVKALDLLGVPATRVLLKDATARAFERTRDNGATEEELLAVASFARWKRRKDSFVGWLNVGWLWSARQFPMLLVAAREQDARVERARRTEEEHARNREARARGEAERAQADAERVQAGPTAARRHDTRTDDRQAAARALLEGLLQDGRPLRVDLVRAQATAEGHHDIPLKGATSLLEREGRLVRYQAGGFAYLLPAEQAPALMRELALTAAMVVSGDTCPAGAIQPGDVVHYTRTSIKIPWLNPETLLRVERIVDTRIVEVKAIPGGAHITVRARDLVKAVQS